MTTAKIEEIIINKLRELYLSGYAADDLDAFIDNNFYLDGDDDTVYLIKNQEEVENDTLKQIVALSYSIYFGEEMDKLLQLL